MHILKHNLLFIILFMFLLWFQSPMTAGSPVQTNEVTGTITFGVLINVHGNVTSPQKYQDLTRVAMSYVAFTLQQENILPSATIDFEYRYTNGTARNATAALVSLYADGIRFVIGPETDLEFQAVLPIARSLNMVLISPWSSTDVLYDISMYTNALAMRAGNSISAQALYDLIDHFGITRIAIVSTHVPYIIDEEVAFNQIYANSSKTIVFAERISDIHNQTLITNVVGRAVNTSGIQAAVVFAPPSAIGAIGSAFDALNPDIPVFFSRHSIEENVLLNINFDAFNTYLGVTDPEPSTEFQILFQNRGLIASAREGFLHDSAITLAKAIELADTATNTTAIIENLVVAKDQLIQQGTGYVMSGYSPVKFSYSQVQSGGVINVGSWFTTNSTTLNDNFMKIRGNLEPVTTTITSTQGGFLAFTPSWIEILSLALLPVLRKKKFSFHHQ